MFHVSDLKESERINFINVFKLILNSPCAQQFINPATSNTYSNIVKNPIFLSQIYKKLDGHEYNSKQDIIDDLFKIVYNTEIFYGPLSKEAKLARETIKLFGVLLTDEINATTKSWNEKFNWVIKNINRKETRPKMSHYEIKKMFQVTNKLCELEDVQIMLQILLTKKEKVEEISNVAYIDAFNMDNETVWLLYDYLMIRLTEMNNDINNMIQ